MLTVAGPKAREVLKTLPGMIDLSTESFPHMSFASGQFEDGTQFRIQRVSFTGEQSYELSVPANRATEFFESVWQAGEPHGIGLFGAESQMVLRLEKGFLHVGVDTDGMTNPFDVGFGGIVARKQTDFIGKRSLLRADDQRQDRRQFVGVEPLDDNEKLLSGAHFVVPGDAGRRSQGVVTSACFSPTLNRSIGLGLLEGGFERKGEIVTVFDDGRTFEVRITDPAFYDPTGERMHA